MRRLFLGCLATSIAAAVLSVPALAADTIKIGLVNETTGPNAEAGVYTVNGARLALEEINKAGGILGKQVELLLEDNQSTNPGTVLAYSKLARRRRACRHRPDPQHADSGHLAERRQGRHSDHVRRHATPASRIPATPGCSVAGPTIRSPRW